MTTDCSPGEKRNKKTRNKTRRHSEVNGRRRRVRTPSYRYRQTIPSTRSSYSPTSTRTLSDHLYSLLSLFVFFTFILLLRLILHSREIPPASQRHYGYNPHATHTRLILASSPTNFNDGVSTLVHIPATALVVQDRPAIPVPR